MTIVKSILKNTFFLIFGKLAAKAFTVVFIAFLARAIGPEGVGKYTFYGSLIAVFMILPNFGFDMLLVRDVARSRDRAKEFIANILSIKLLLSIVASLLLISYIRWRQYDNQMTQIVLLLLVLYILMGALTSFYSVFRAYERMEFEALLLFVNNLLRLGFGITAIMIGMNLKGIIIGLILADFLASLFGVSIIYCNFTSLSLKINLQRLKQILLSAIPFGLLSLTNVVWMNTDNLMIGKLIGEKAVGWYSAADKILMFTLLIPSMFMNALFPVLSRLNISSKNSLRQTYSKSFSYMLMMAFPIAIGGFLVSEQLILLFYGEQFRNTILVFQVMVWVNMFSFVGYVNGATLNATGREKMFVSTYSAFILANIILDYIFIKKFGYIGACYVTLILAFLGFFFYSSVCHRQLKVKPEWPAIAKSFAAAVIMGGVVLFLRVTLSNVFIAIFVGAITYLALISLLRAIPKEDASVLLNIVKRKT